MTCPDDVHRRLKAQAALAGQSLNEFLRARMCEIARTPTVGGTDRSASALAARLELPPSAEIVHAERERR